MKKILIPTDFSACAGNAEKFGLYISHKINAELTFLHIIHTPVDWTKLTKEQEDHFPDAKTKIAEAKQKLNDLVKKAEAKGIPSRKTLIFSNKSESLYKYVENENIDLIVMGSHGVYGFKDYVLGTNTYTMLRNTLTPVMVIKSAQENLKLDNLVFATDFKEESGTTFRKVETLAETLQVKLHIVYINTPTHFKETNDIHKAAKSFLAEFSTYAHKIKIVDAFNEERGIIQFANRIEADGIVLITSGKSDLKQYFTPSITENLIGLASQPIISIKLSTK